jgi:hypothetical protein
MSIPGIKNLSAHVIVSEIGLENEAEAARSPSLNQMAPTRSMPHYWVTAPQGVNSYSALRLPRDQPEEIMQFQPFMQILRGSTSRHGADERQYNNLSADVTGGNRATNINIQDR